MSSTPNYLTLAYEGNYAGTLIIPRSQLRVEIFTYKGQAYSAIPSLDLVAPIPSINL